MNIRFLCPSCRQPLEIDQQWAGQSVACPYCKRVVAAPMSNTWEPPVSIPTARPAGSGFEPPPPPMGVAPIPAMSASGSSARWALGLALSSIVLMLFGMFIFMVLFSEMVQERVGSKATQEDILRSAQDMMAKGEVPHSAKITVPVLTATLFSLFSLGLAIRSLTRGEHNRGTAIVACLLSILLLFCQLGTILNSVVKHVPSPVSVHEYSLHVRP